MTLAICPGSFDPPTNGHVDVVERARRHFDEILVAVVDSPSKKPLFDPAERVALMRHSLSHLNNVRVEEHEGLLVDLARSRGAQVIVKGLRATSDLEYELQMAQMNARLLEAVDTLFVVTNPKWSFISSSLIKEVARHGGEVAGLVPEAVKAALSAKLSGSPHEGE
ncbi:MAG: pantetheine-phosphate adenylyltransferase [Actinomycetota bacterium]